MTKATTSKIILPFSKEAGHDPAKQIHDALKDARVDLDGIRIEHNNILVACYIGSEKIAGTSLLRTQNQVKEDEYQGKVGLVLKVGPGAYLDDDRTKFHGMTIAPGDWVLTMPTAGWQLKLGGMFGGVLCKIVQDTSVKAKVSDPDGVF
jgi:hypothetical protein